MPGMLSALGSRCRFSDFSFRIIQCFNHWRRAAAPLHGPAVFCDNDPYLSPRKCQLRFERPGDISSISDKQAAIWRKMLALT
jgi:hypothetical protein